MLCGSAGDGGIDLIAVKGDQEFAVQVKRRSSRNSVERVHTVRELLGACLLRGAQHAVFVTTADHFSGSPSGAVDAAKRSVDQGLVRSFELINGERLLRMFNMIH